MGFFCGWRRISPHLFAFAGWWVMLIDGRADNWRVMPCMPAEIEWRKALLFPPTSCVRSPFVNMFRIAVASARIGWKIFQKTEGKGAGDLCLGFGFDLQYWVPTTHMSPDNHVQSSNFDEMNYIYSHYMRVPVTLNISYEFKVNAGAIRRVGPLFSLGMNNNIFYFSYSTDQEGEQEYWDYRFDEGISHWKVSGTWELGMGMVFENNWILNTSIGGDFGSQNIRSYLLYGKTGTKYDKILYDHHEFLMFETGYRF